MKNFRFSAVSLILLYVFFINSISSVFACGPFITAPIFALTKHGDYPLIDYAKGKTGIVPTSYGRMSLFVFYRELIDLPLTAAEQKQVQAALAHRIGSYIPDGSESSANDSSSAPNYFQNWKAARAKVLNVDVKIPIDKQAPDEYSYYENCLPDAFNNATQTLNARMTQYGTGDDVKEWLQGQDAVFSNCGAQGTIPADVSANAAQWLKNDRQYQIAAALFYSDKYAESRAAFEKIAADKNSAWSKTANFVIARTYIRQASFIDTEQPDYAPTPTPNPNSATDSAADNANIAQQAASNAARVAANVARMAANAVNANAGNSSSSSPTPTPKIIKSVDEKLKEKKDLLDQAEARLKNILSDASMSEFQPSAQRLLGLVMFRNFPKERRAKLGEVLTQKSENQNIGNDLTDYILLLDKIDVEAQSTGEEIDRAAAEKAGKEYEYDYHLKLRDVPANERAADLTDWLITYQSFDGFAHSYEKWKATGGTQWLVAALAQAQKSDSQVSELMSAGDKISRNSPAFINVRYHQIRLLIENGNRAEAKSKLDEIFAADFKNLPISSQNKFYAQRMILAGNLDEFLKYAQRQPALFVSSDDGNETGETLDEKNDNGLFAWKNRTMFDDDAVAFFNEKMPLSVLRQAALSQQLPDHLKKFLVVATWTRSVVLGNQAVEREFAPLVIRYAPEYADYFSKYNSAAAPAARESAMLIAILRYPVIQPYVTAGLGREISTATSIDSIRGNWWCAEDVNKKNNEYNDSNHYDEYDFKYPAAYPNFLTAAQTAEAEKEHQQILSAGSSATFLTRRAIDFANRNPNDPNTPELLHLAVRSTRYGCKDSATSPLSKQAFNILHQRYPSSEWTKKTPYWF